MRVSEELAVEALTIIVDILEHDDGKDIATTLILDPSYLERMRKWLTAVRKEN